MRIEHGDAQLQRNNCTWYSGAMRNLCCICLRHVFPPLTVLPLPAGRSSLALLLGFERVIPVSEVAQHAKDDDCWMIIHGKVYDVTGFLVDHPGQSPRCAQHERWLFFQNGAGGRTPFSERAAHLWSSDARRTALQFNGLPR
jgi:hypothetical protein